MLRRNCNVKLDNLRWDCPDLSCGPVSKQMRFEVLKTLCRNHRERRRRLVEVFKRLSLENPGGPDRRRVG